MAGWHRWRTRRARVMDRLEARRAARARPATGITSQPEPRTVGQPARGRQLMAGNFRFAGALMQQSPQASPWKIKPPSPGFAAALHGFGWLDDLAALGDARARQMAMNWVQDWIALYGRGGGPGWSPDLAGRRLIRWIGHALFLLRGQEAPASGAFYRSLGQQTIFLARRWRSAAEGAPRIEALTGMIYASLSLSGMEPHLAPALAALERDCARTLDAGGAIPTRNPEELLEVFSLLGWAAAVLRENGRMPGPEHSAAMARIAPVLRALRHADGGLARFHGGGRGDEGRLDHALAEAGVRALPGVGLHMGYGRLQAGRSTVIVDAALPPHGRASRDAHASTLGFELTSGRRPLVVNCGSGLHFGADWHRAGRATPSHSVLVLDGMSSSRLSPPDDTSGEERLIAGPSEVLWDLAVSPEVQRIEVGHDGWRQEYGVTHARTLDLHAGGRALVGEDILTTLSATDEAALDAQIATRGLSGIPFVLRFHLHPDTDASLDLDGGAVSIALKSGETWIFRCEGPVDIALEPSVYLESRRLRPRAATQVVLSGAVLSYATRVRWAFAKAHDTPTALRDIDLPDEGQARVPGPQQQDADD